MRKGKHGNEISQERVEMLEHDINCYRKDVVSFAGKIIVNEHMLRFGTQAEKAECVSQMLLNAKALLESIAVLKELI